MEKLDENHVKILFRFYSNVLDEWTVQTTWAEIVDAERGLYKIDSIPFYASIASGDIILAEYDESEQILTYRETVEYSGNSTVQVVVMDKTLVTNDIRDIFSALGCLSEKSKEGYFVLEIPADRDYKPIKQKLKELLDKGVLDYAEPCLSTNHSY
jgi:hypothetical protein